MSIDRIVLAVAGSFILLSVLAWPSRQPIFHHPSLWFTGFVGANLLQSAFTGFCPLALILKKMGKVSGAAF